MLVLLLGATYWKWLGLLWPDQGRSSDPVHHAAMGLTASLASILAHMWRGGGADLGASLVLALGVMLGIGVPDAVVSAWVHWVVAMAGVALSTWVHLGHLRRRAGSPPGARPTRR